LSPAPVKVALNIKRGVRPSLTTWNNAMQSVVFLVSIGELED
jgi:hypothetical protein